MSYQKMFLLLLTLCTDFSHSMTFKQNVVILYIENINEVMKLLTLLDPENSSKDVLGNIRKLYNESIQFHNVYGEVASASNFAALITGKSAVELGIIRGKVLPFDYFPSIASTGGLKLEELTLAEALREYGYRTWFTGYWKLGLGPSGNGYPIKHGFDTWMGVAHPHDEWCRRKDIDDILREKNHPYVNLLYKISFLWSLVFLVLTTLVWVKFIGVKLFINLIIYTFSTSFAFYILLHLFMIQRSASCVLYYHDFIYQQPYEAKNLTLHFTQHSSKLIDIAAGRTPFFMVLNYLKMKPPYFHSNYFRTKSTTTTWSSSLLELDWSIGQIVHKLKETDVYNETVVIVTGNNNCELNMADSDMLAYERYARNDFRKVKVPSNTLSNGCLNIPFFIKDNANNGKSTIFTSQVYDHVPVTDVFETILDLSSSDQTRSYPSSLVKLYKRKHCKPEFDLHINIPMSKTSLAIIHNETFILNSTEDRHEHQRPVDTDDMVWLVESEDEDVTIEAYVINEEDSSSLCLHGETVYKQHQCLFHYYNVQKPIAITYQGGYQIIYAYYYGSGQLQKMDSPIIVDLQNKNASHVVLEEVYQNVTQALQSHLRERQIKTSYSSEFEMPVYPWLLPCANFPRCETWGEGHAEFSELMSSVIENG